MLVNGGLQKQFIYTVRAGKQKNMRRTSPGVTGSPVNLLGPTEIFETKGYYSGVSWTAGLPRILLEPSGLFFFHISNESLVWRTQHAQKIMKLRSNSVLKLFMISIYFSLHAYELMTLNFNHSICFCSHVWLVLIFCNAKTYKNACYWHNVILTGGPEIWVEYLILATASHLKKCAWEFLSDLLHLCTVYTEHSKDESYKISFCTSEPEHIWLWKILKFISTSDWSLGSH